MLGAPMARLVLRRTRRPPSWPAPRVSPGCSSGRMTAMSVIMSGASQTALDLTATYVKEREQFGRAIATFQAVSQRPADTYINKEAIKLTAWQAAWRLDAGVPGGRAGRHGEVLGRGRVGRTCSSPRTTCTVVWASTATTPCTATSCWRSRSSSTSAPRRPRSCTSAASSPSTPVGSHVPDDGCRARARLRLAARSSLDRVAAHGCGSNYRPDRSQWVRDVHQVGRRYSSLLVAVGALVVAILRRRQLRAPGVVAAIGVFVTIGAALRARSPARVGQPRVAGRHARGRLQWTRAAFDAEVAVRDRQRPRRVAVDLRVVDLLARRARRCSSSSPCDGVAARPTIASAGPRVRSS